MALNPVNDPFDGLRADLADRYRIGKEIGAGGMAVVFEATDLRHDRPVAVKVLRPGLAGAVGPDRFLREIGIAAKLHHPHILPLLDSGEGGGHLFYVMPLVEGTSLRDRLDREGELPVGEAARILMQLADALASAHGEGIVHRDVKPSNVLLKGRHGLIADFGVAKALEGESSELTTAGVTLGTPAYMAPEQASGESEVDHRTDIYALGAVGYELLTGQAPFAGSPQRVLLAKMSSLPTRPSDLRAAVPQGLSDVIMRCLEARPADRWQSAEELERALEPFLTPSGAHSTISTRRAPVWGKRLGWAAAVVIVAITAGGWWMTSVDRSAPPSEGEALDPAGRVVVLPFTTPGDGEDGLGQLGATTVERMITQSALADLVSYRSVADALEGDRPPVSEVARLARAGLVVQGQYFVGADGYRVAADVLDPSSSRVLFSIDGEPAQEPMAAFREAGDRVLGALATHYDAELPGPSSTPSPPASR